MLRSPFGVLNEEYFPHEKRSLQVSQSQQEPFVGLGGARRMSSLRPRSAPGHRKSSVSAGNRPSSASGHHTTNNQSTSSLHKEESSATISNSQRSESPAAMLERPATNTLLDYNEENRKTKKTINNIELTQEDWNKILVKYNIQDIASIKYDFLKRGTGFTTKLDHIAKERPKSASATGRLRKSTSDFGTDEAKDIIETDQPHVIEDEMIEDIAIHFMRERNSKKKQDDDLFAKQLQKEKDDQILQIKRCIEEINQFCQYLQKPCAYRYLDDKQVEKEVHPSHEPQIGISGIVHQPTGVFSEMAKTAFWSTRYAETPELNPLSRPSSANNKKKKVKSQNQPQHKVISLTRFYQEHEQLYKEYKNIIKHNNAAANIESMKPLESNHFIGVDDLYSAARKHEEEVKLKEENQQQQKQHMNNMRQTSQSTSSKSKKAPVQRPPTSDDDEDDVHITTVDSNYNEMLRRNEVISMQQKIIEEFDEIQDLLSSQIMEIQSKGWNIQFRDNFLTSEYLR